MLPRVAISAQTRKLLWGRSGGLCAICKRPLTADSAEPEPAVVVGEECHIVSGKPGGPRFRALASAVVDADENLILLCPSDHEIIDKQPLHYTEQTLREVKAQHEAWVRALPGPPELQIRQRQGEATLLHLVESGRDVMAFVAGSHAAEVITPEARDTAEADLVGGFVQNIQDWADIWGEVDMAGRLRAEIEMTDAVQELREAGFIVYCARRRGTIEGGSGRPSPWRTAIISVFRTDDPHVVAQRSDADRAAVPPSEDQLYWREQIVSLAYPLIGRIETYADFEIDGEIRAAVLHYVRQMRGIVKGKFRHLAAELPSEADEERVLSSGTRSELIELVKTYARLFD
jgi:hypothetical protein